MELHHSDTANVAAGVIAPSGSASQKRWLTSQPLTTFLNLLGLALVGTLAFTLFVAPGLLCCLMLGDSFGEAITRATHNYWCLLVDAAFWGLGACCICLMLDQGQIRSLPDRAEA